jgi:hypothetical protein
MANEILAVSSRRRNSILGSFSANQENLGNYGASDDYFNFLLPELNTIIGLAFTAVLTEETNLVFCRYELNCFLNNRDLIQDESMLEMVLLPSITYILESGFSAFKSLGYPRYYDDFIASYRCILGSTKLVPPALKREMHRIYRMYT